MSASQPSSSAPTPGSPGEIVVDGASFSVRTRHRGIVPLVDGCSFVAERGKLTAIVGPSGCGKTTLMSLIAGYFPPVGGRLLLNGKPFSGPGWDRLMVFQESSLFPWMTTRDNVAYGPMVRGLKPLADIRREADALLEQFGLGEFTHRYPRELSGGMQRRGEFARALINNPLVLLMDEPFRGLDAMTRQLMQEYLIKLFEETRTTTIFVTSEIDEAIFLADRVVVLTRAPASVKAILDVDLPRPRTFEMQTSEPFARLKERVLDLLYEEATATFSQSGQLSDLKEAIEKRQSARPL